MRFFIPFTVFSVVTHSSWSQTTSEPIKQVLEGIAPDKSGEDTLKLSSQDGNTKLTTLWTYKPDSHELYGSAKENLRGMAFRAPHSLTKLAKTLDNGFDPYFNKGFFEPFERRSKPITLVAFRRNGLMPRTVVKSSGMKPESSSSKVAELQSPFNDISNSWMDTPGEPS